jgi:hypothetical protein
MSFGITRTLAAAALLIGLSGAGRLALAEETLPKADVIIEKYIEVTGGKAAYGKVHNEISTGTLELVGKGIKGTLTIYRAEPDKSYTLTEIEGVGKVEEGSDGQVAWTRSAMTGPRLKEGEEKATSLRSGRFNAELHWREHFKKVETAGVEDVNGQPCYKVVMTPAEGSPVTRYYDKKSNMLVKTAMTIKIPMGEFPVESVVSDYRKEGEILMPHRLNQKMAGNEILITIEGVKYNAEIPKGTFDLPEDVKPLVNKK